MNSNKQLELIASLYEEFILAKGLIKGIRSERCISESKTSLERMDKAIKAAS